jgi:hypothetical protein
MSDCPLPEGKVNNETIENVVLFSLESSNPFLPNGISCGYMVDDEAVTFCAFCSVNDCLKAIDTPAEAIAYILPDFLTLSVKLFYL